MVALPAWALKVVCYYGIITCNTRPGVWPNSKPSVVSWEPPHITTTHSLTTTAAALTATSVSLSTVSSLSSSTVTIPLPSNTRVIVTIPTESILPTTAPPSTFVTSSLASSIDTSSSVDSPSPLSSGSLSVSTSVSNSASLNPSSSSAIPSFPTMSSSAVSISASTSASSAVIANNILVIARDTASAGVASSGLNAYGIPFTTLLIPQTGVDLPALNTSIGGSFGGIVVASEVSYDYGADGYQSALTTDQWNQLYAYQLEYGVRMV